MARLIDADEAIKAIYERHCMECVSRKGMKNGKVRVLYDIGDAPCRACLIDDMKTMIDDAPTVDAEPVRHGHIEADGYTYTCSVCESRLFEHDLFWRYCPYCGARLGDTEE